MRGAVAPIDGEVDVERTLERAKALAYAFRQQHAVGVKLDPGLGPGFNYARRDLREGLVDERLPSPIQGDFADVEFGRLQLGDVISGVFQCQEASRL
jgi:hypothetical protein